LVLTEIMDRQMCLSNICIQLREMEMRLLIYIYDIHLIK